MREAAQATSAPQVDMHWWKVLSGVVAADGVLRLDLCRALLVCWHICNRFVAHLLAQLLVSLQRICGAQAQAPKVALPAPASFGRQDAASAVIREEVSRFIAHYTSCFCSHAVRLPLLHHGH